MHVLAAANRAAARCWGAPTGGGAAVDPAPGMRHDAAADMSAIEQTQSRTYRLVRPLGRGGSSWVWEAEVIGAPGDAASKPRTVVVKRLDGRDLASERMYRSELAALGTLRHAHIVELLDHGVADGALHVVLEHVDGADLGRALADGPLAPAMALALTLDVALALAHAHAPRQDAPGGIVHRDLRPENVLVARDGHAKLTDFGLARGTLGREGTRSDAVRGAPGFVAPESVRGALAGPPADVWALGALLHTLVAGRSPIRSFEHAHAVAQGAPLELDPALAGPARELVVRCLARGPEERPSAAWIAGAARESLGAQASGARIALAAWARAIGARERGSLDDLFFSSASPTGSGELVLERPA